MAGFLALLERKFAQPGFYLLDEPEAALSFTSTLSLLARLADLIWPLAGSRNPTGLVFRRRRQLARSDGAA
jgi:hypothetical protein